MINLFKFKSKKTTELVKEVNYLKQQNQELEKRTDYLLDCRNTLLGQVIVKISDCGDKDVYLGKTRLAYIYGHINLCCSTYRKPMCLPKEFVSWEDYDGLIIQIKKYARYIAYYAKQEYVGAEDEGEDEGEDADNEEED